MVYRKKSTRTSISFVPFSSKINFQCIQQGVYISTIYFLLLELYIFMFLEEYSLSQSSQNLVFALHVAAAAVVDGQRKKKAL